MRPTKTRSDQTKPKPRSLSKIGPAKVAEMAALKVCGGGGRSLHVEWARWACPKSETPKCVSARVRLDALPATSIEFEASLWFCVFVQPAKLAGASICLAAAAQRGRPQIS